MHSGSGSGRDSAGRVRRAWRSALALAGSAAAVLALLVPILVARRAEPAAPRVKRPNILLVTLDTTRADRLGCYGYSRNTSPELDRLARESVVYDRAYSTSSWTLPAHASLFTGRFPRSHGAIYDKAGALALTDGIEAPRGAEHIRARPPAPDLPVMAEILARAGYETGAAVAGPWMKRVFGLGRGFAHYDDAQISTVSGRLARQVTESALAWIDVHKDERFFLFLNYYDPHGPFTDPEGLSRHFLPEGVAVWPPPDNPSPEILNAWYDGEVRYMDRHIGRLFERLRELGLYDDLWILVTADHGELLGEHGWWGHGEHLTEVEIRIPLIVKAPRGEAAPGRSQAPVQLTDLLPTILKRLELPAPSSIQGSAAPASRPPLFAEVYPLLQKRSNGDWRALLDGDFKLLWNSRGEHRLFDVAHDPLEATDLAPRQPDRLARMQSELDVLVAGLPLPETAAPTPEVDVETREALENLGYLE